jgi:glycosyltransferase involved in cell wall biosynthesis
MVVTGFNQEATILETLRSIEAQTYPNVEVVVVDGGGKDRMGALAQEFLAQSRFKGTFFRQPENLGMTRDRHRGFELARGELVCFLDADDLAFVDRAERQVKQLLDNDCDAVYGNLVRLYEDVGRVPYQGAPTQAAEQWDPERFVRNLVCHLGPMAQGGLFRRSLLEEIGGVDQGFEMNDWPFMIEAARRARRMLVSRDAVFYYRIHAAGHHVKHLEESMRWQLKAARHYCSPALARKSAAVSQRVVANEYLRRGEARQALRWFAKAAAQARQPKAAEFLGAVVGAAVRRRRKEAP